MTSGAKLIIVKTIQSEWLFLQKDWWPLRVMVWDLVERIAQRNFITWFVVGENIGRLRALI